MTGSQEGELLLKERPAWGFFDLVMIYIGSFLLTAWFALSLRGGMGRSFLAPGRELGDFEYFIFTYFIQVLVVLLLILAAARWRGAALGDFGIRWSSAANWLKYGVIGGIFAALFILFSGAVIQVLNPQLSPQGFEVMLRVHQSPKDYLILFFMGSVLAPFSEELFYRGMVYPVFRYHLGKAWGMACAGAVFGLAHWDLWRALPLALGGAFLCFVYEKSESILVSTLAHGIWNGILTILIYFSINLSL